MKALKTIKRAVAAALFLLFCATAIWMWWRSCAGVSNRQILDAVREEGSATRLAVEAHCGELARKLDSIESKLDLLIDMAKPRLPDGMTPAQ